MQNFWCKAIKSDEKIVFGVVSLEKIANNFLAFGEPPPPFHGLSYATEGKGDMIFAKVEVTGTY